MEALRDHVLDRETEALRSELGSGAPDVARIVSELRARLDVEPSAPRDPDEDRYRLLATSTPFVGPAPRRWWGSVSRGLTRTGEACRWPRNLPRCRWGVRAPARSSGAST